MNCRQYWNKTLGESSIHGFPYLVKRELHWSEKIFWAAVIISATYFSLDICLNQWKRFRDNPIVYAMELAWGKSNFPFVGITLCSESTDQEDLDNIIHEMWDVKAEENNATYQYYLKFLKVLNSLNYLNMDTLKGYENDTNLEELKFVEILLQMRHRFLPRKIYANAEDDNKKSSSFDVEGREQTYAAAMTEIGICRTTSQLTRYTNPFGNLKSLKVSGISFCDTMNECNTKIFPKVGSESSLLIFLHNVEDIVAPFGKGTIMRHATMDGSLTIELLLGLTTAETEVRNLPIAYRKCRYKDENNLNYFKIYRPGLCRIECRINVAMKKCGCKPFFYVVAPHLPICSIKGMLCLTQHNWPKVAQCNCPNLCEKETYVSMQTTLQKDESTKFERTIIVKLFLPRMAMKRRVVFSTDQLIMSFGGAIGLFLGASFISIYGLIYVCSEYVFANIWSSLKLRRNARKEQQNQQQLNRTTSFGGRRY
ncbi:pickpocket 25 [Cochliomyia hominivorax]